MGRTVARRAAAAGDCGRGSAAGAIDDGHPLCSADCEGAAAALHRLDMAYVRRLRRRLAGNNTDAMRREPPGQQMPGAAFGPDGSV